MLAWVVGRTAALGVVAGVLFGVVAGGVALGGTVVGALAGTVVDELWTTSAAGFVVVVEVVVVVDVLLDELADSFSPPDFFATGFAGVLGVVALGVVVPVGDLSNPLEVEPTGRADGG